MRYQGATYYRRDSSSNDDNETLYACSGKAKKSQQCDGIISFSMDNIYGEIIESKRRLIRYRLHSDW